MFSLRWSLPLVMAFISLVAVPVIAQTGDHAAFIESVRKAVKEPVGNHALYSLVIQPEFGTTVREAAKSGNDALVIELLQAYSGGTDDKARGGTALTWAAYYCDAELLKILLDRGLNVNARDNYGDTPLHQAFGVGRTDIVGMILEKGANVNLANREGTTPLMLAAADKEPVNTKALLDRSAKVDARNNDGETPLMLAAKRGRLANVKLLLAAGAKINLKDRKENTALTIAEKSPGAPFTGYHDSPGYLDAEMAAKLEVKAKSDQREIIKILKDAGRR